MFFRKEIILKRNIKKFISCYAKNDNWHNMDPNNGGLGYGWIHYSIIRLTRPERVLCIGSKYGFIPAVCALACRDNGFGVVDFVDAGYDMADYEGHDEHWGGAGVWKKCNPMKYFSKFNIEKYIKLHVMTTDEFSSKHPNAKYSYIHVDGDHSYSGVKRDYKLFWPKLLKNGFMSFHDVASPDTKEVVYGTRTFWSELKEKHPTVIEFLKDPGLGIIQKIKK